VHNVSYSYQSSSLCESANNYLTKSNKIVIILFKVILYSYLMLKKMNERITDS